MLLPWLRSLFSDELRIFVHPQYILLTHLKRNPGAGFKHQAMQQQVFSVDLFEPSNQWDALKYQLADALNSDQWQNVIKLGICASVVVSSHFARYASIPWSVELAVESERQAFMRYRFGTLFGEAVKTWDLRMSEPGFGQPAIASGIDSKLLTTLDEVLTANNVKVNSVSPYLMLAINQSMQQLKQKKVDPDFWFVVMESGRLCFALVEKGAWRVIKNIAVEMDLSAQVNTLIQREIINCDISARLPIVVYQMGLEADYALTIANFKTIKIQPDGFEQIANHHESTVNRWSEVRI